MKKILFLIQDLGHGGAEKVLVNLVNNMDKSKYDVTVKTLFDTGVNKQYLRDDVHYIPGLKWEFRGNSHLFRLLPARWLYKFFVKDKYDIIVSYLEGSATRVLSGCTSKDIKRVAWIHTAFDTDKKYSLGFNSKKSTTDAYADFDKVVFVSDTAKQAFEEIAQKTFENGIVLYNTVETETIISKSLEPIEDVTFSEEKINICSVGKIDSNKGYDRLAKVHKKLLDEGFMHNIYILGVGEQKDKIEVYISENNLSKSFAFLGYRSNPYNYVRNCDLYVCSSHQEGFSTAVTEALVVGTPVVSTCCSGAHELLGYNNEYGIVTENSEEGIYEGLKQMLSDKELLDHYQKQATLRGKRFSTKNTVLAVEQMFDTL